MKVASLCSFPVGVVRWRSPSPSLTVVVKVTVALSGDEPSIAEQQEPLTLDRRRRSRAGLELDRSSDFAPKKARADVLVVGHARASSPARVIPARICVGDVDKRFFAVSQRPSREVRLSEANLRRSPSSDAPATSVGPRDLEGGEGGALSRWDALLRTPLAPSFDFGAFNVAPRDQQAESLDAGLRLSLEGLLPGAPRADIWLPSERPRIYAMARGASDAGPLIEIPLQCDTLWIDVDRAICSLSWRGALTVSDGREMPSQLAATSAPTWIEEHPSSVMDRLRQASVVRAVEASDLASSPAVIDEESAPVDESDDEGEEAPVTPVARVALGAFRLGAATAAPRGPARAPTPIEEPTTAPLVDDDLVIEEIVDEGTDIDDEVTSAPTVRPVAISSIRLNSSEITVEYVLPAATQSARRWDDEGTAVHELNPSRVAHVLPFQSVAPLDSSSFIDVARAPALAPEPAPALAPEPAFTSMPEPALASAPSLTPALTPEPALASAPMFTLTPAPAPAPVLTPVSPPAVRAAPVVAPLLPLSTYAAVRAAVWEEGAPLEEVIERFGIDELAWHDSEQRRREELAEEASRGGAALALAMAAAMAGERARRGSASDSELTIDDYVAIRVAVDAASDAGWVLRERGLTTAAWQRADRAWRSLARADASVAAALRAKLAEKRRPSIELASPGPIVGRRIKIARPPA